MKERPILFSGEMVRAILDGRKTQTRRVIKPQPVLEMTKDGEQWVFKHKMSVSWLNDSKGPWDLLLDLCPYGQPGDRLYVRETWRCRGGREYEYQQHQPSIMYYADATIDSVICDDWRPSIHMPKWASRILIEIESVRVERVQEITPNDCRAEGIGDEFNDIGARYCFGQLWNSINEPRGLGWDVNPLVWAITFRRVK